VGDELQAAWHAGRSAWPAIALERTRFEAFAAGLAGEAASRFSADVYLAAARLGGDPAALAAFDREILSAGRAAIAAIDAGAAFVDEAVQRLRASLLVGDGTPRLALYAGRGPLRAWVGVAGARTALMMRRSQQRAREVPIDDDDWSGALATISTNNPELELLKRQYAEAFAAALREAVAALEPRARTVLRMSFRRPLDRRDRRGLRRPSRHRRPLDPARLRRRPRAHPRAPRATPRSIGDRARPDDRARKEPARGQPLAAPARDRRLVRSPVWSSRSLARVGFSPHAERVRSERSAERGPSCTAPKHLPRRSSSPRGQHPCGTTRRRAAAELAPGEVFVACALGDETACRRTPMKRCDSDRSGDLVDSLSFPPSSLRTTIPPYSMVWTWPIPPVTGRSFCCGSRGSVARSTASSAR
jgi:hypothetical protein